MPNNNEYGAFCIGQQYYVAMHLTDTNEWDYTVYDICFRPLDGGQIGEEMDCSLPDALTEICKLHDLLGDEMTVNEVDDEILETLVDRIEENAATEELAIKLNNFGYDYDLYSYRDVFDTRMDGFEQMLECIQDEQFEEIEEYLLDALDNGSTDELAQRAENLLNDIRVYKEKYLMEGAASDDYAASL